LAPWRKNSGRIEKTELAGGYFILEKENNFGFSLD